MQKWDIEKKEKLYIYSPYEIRFYNDQLLQFERAFLNPLGQGGDLTDLKYEFYISVPLISLLTFMKGT